MTNLTILIKYDGKWVNSSYKGGKTKALVVSEKLTYEELRDRLYGLMKVDPNEYGITMKAVYSGKSHPYPAEVVDDNDVAAFICESVARDWKIPMCVTLERRVLASGSGSNQQAPIGLATHTTKCHSLDPHTQHEEQNSFDFISSPMPMDFSSGTQANSDCVDGLIHDDFENDKEHDNIEVDVEQNTLQHDDVPCDKLQLSEVPQPNLQFDDLPHDSGRFDNMYHENMQFCDHHLNPPKSLPRARSWRKLTEEMVNRMLNSGLKAGRDMELGSVYKSKKDLQKMLALAAIKRSFEFKVKRSTRKRFAVECVNDNCTWKVHATKSPDSDYFMITKHDSRHSCSSDAKNLSSLDAKNGSHRQASSLLIGEFVKSKYKGVLCQRKPKNIIEDVQKDLGVNISYSTAKRVLDCALKDIGVSSPELSSKQRLSERCKKERTQSQPEKMSRGEKQFTRNCGKCGSTGHYRKTCKNPITLHLNSESEFAA